MPFTFKQYLLFIFSTLLFINQAYTLAIRANANQKASTSSPSATGGSKTGQCTDVLIINARGTGEIRGFQSSAFLSVNSKIQSQFTGAKVYNVNYAASVTQMSDGGANDIIKKVQSTSTSNPNTCIFLEGYSQGAAATVKALTQLSSYKQSIRGIALVGDPKSSTGLQSAFFGGGGNQEFKCKTLDICAVGDGLCGKPDQAGMGLGHFDYIVNPRIHQKITDFAIKALTSGADTCSSGGASTGGGTVGSTGGGSTGSKGGAGQTGTKTGAAGLGGLSALPGLSSLGSLGNLIPKMQ